MVLHRAAQGVLSAFAASSVVPLQLISARLPGGRPASSTSHVQSAAPQQHAGQRVATPHHDEVEQQPMPEDLLGQLQGDQRVRRGVQLLPQRWLVEHQLSQLLAVDFACRDCRCISTLCRVEFVALSSVRNTDSVL